MREMEWPFVCAEVRALHDILLSQISWLIIKQIILTIYFLSFEIVFILNIYFE